MGRYVELKTSKLIKNDRDVRSFERCVNDLLVNEMTRRGRKEVESKSKPNDPMESGLGTNCSSTGLNASCLGYHAL